MLSHCFAADCGYPGFGFCGQHAERFLEDVGGQVIEQKVSIPQAHTYFSEKNRPENLTLKAEIQQLMRLVTMDREKK